VPAGLAVSRAPEGTIRGLAYFGGQLVLAADDGAALDDIAGEMRRIGGVRSIVGPRAEADGAWERVRGWHAPPVLIRTCQPLYQLMPGVLPPGDDPGVRLARDSETELIAAHSAQMILGELGYDPRATRAGFVGSVRKAIAAGLWWVWMVDGELRFQCSIGPRTAQTAQLQGVWTPFDQRQRGYASVGLAAICRRLLATEATLTLYVNDFNAPAIALYEKLGFVRIGAFATYVFT
jgi:ribosomal protein S18 acetylase RimI-like enzyme